MMEIFKKLRVDKKFHDRLFAMTQQLDLIESDVEILTEFIKANLKYLREK
jgi:hypothetical protein